MESDYQLGEIYYDNEGNQYNICGIAALGRGTSILFACMEIASSVKVVEDKVSLSNCLVAISPVLQNDFHVWPLVSTILRDSNEGELLTARSSPPSLVDLTLYQKPSGNQGIQASGFLASLIVKKTFYDYCRSNKGTAQSC